MGGQVLWEDKVKADTSIALSKKDQCCPFVMLKCEGIGEALAGPL